MKQNLINVYFCLFVVCMALNVIIGGIFMSAKSSFDDQKIGSVISLDNEIAFNHQWGEQAFSKTSEPLIYNNRLKLIHEDHPGDTKIGHCAAGGPLRLRDKIYKHGIGVNSNSVIRISLAQSGDRFIADIGLDRNVDNTVASVRFRVSVDGKDVFATEVMRPNGNAKAIDIPLNGAKEFDLIVDDGGDGRSFDQADWVDARVMLQDGSMIWLDEIANQWLPNTDLPFSFVYGGLHSSEFISSWNYETQEEASDKKRIRTLIFTDPETKLQIRCVAIIYTDTPGIDWTLYFTNKGDRDTPILEKVKALDVSIATGVGTIPVLHRLRGSSCSVADWLPFSEPVPQGKHIDFAPIGGKSSQETCPFFNLECGNGGVITAVGWSGQWCAEVENTQNGLRIQAGMQNMQLSLHPDETIRSPRIMQLYWSGNDLNRSYNLFRQTMLSHIVPKVNGKTATPPIAHLSTSFYELNDSNESNVLSHLESIKDLGFEIFWLDAYWTRDGFPNGMGNYAFPIQRTEPSDRFPNGLKFIGDAVHRANMGFLMWFEPERVASGTEIAKEHPDWVISPNGDGSGLYNFGISEAREYMTKYLITVIKEYRLDWLRIDFNINPLPFWEFMNQKDSTRIGMEEIRYVEGHYQMWDDILKAYPHLAIDNCASGGMRIDLETCSRSIPLWRTDATIDPLMKVDFNQSALQNQLMTAGLSRYVPFNVSGQMGATPYLFRSGFNAGISFCEDCRPADYPLDMLKKGIAEGKRIRKYYFGNFYPLSEITTSSKDWCVIQYHRPVEQDGMIIAFRRHESPYASFVCKPHEIDPEAEYEVTLTNTYDLSEPIKMKGIELQHIKAEIDDCPGSILIEYKIKANK
jgi:alpha-galactosidase